MDTGIGIGRSNRHMSSYVDRPRWHVRRKFQLGIGNGIYLCQDIAWLFFLIDIKGDCLKRYLSNGIE